MSDHPSTVPITLQQIREEIVDYSMRSTQATACKTAILSILDYLEGIEARLNEADKRREKAREAKGKGWDKMAVDILCYNTTEKDKSNE